MEIDKISEVLNSNDPIGLIAMGAPQDEYEQEARAIMQYSGEKNVESLSVFLKELFAKNFDIRSAKDEDFTSLAKDLVNIL